MPRTIGRLTGLAVSRAKEAGMYPDGGGLYLQVTPAGARSWIYRFTLDGRAREMGLGPLYDVPLSDARAKASECRKLRAEGIDPIEARKARRTAAKLDAAKAITFSDCAERYIAAHEASWRNAKHVQQWKNTLVTYAEPVFGSLPVQDVDTGLVVKVLEPIWSTKAETAGRLRGRIEAILDWATVRGYRCGENPARWRGHLAKLLPNQSRVRRVVHHPALPYNEVGAFMATLSEKEGTAARALNFLILTAARTGEVRGATWQEFDLEEKVWTVPANRIKGGKEHRVPLSPAAVAIVRTIQMEQLAEGKLDPDGFVFRGRKSGRPLSDMAFLMLLGRMGRDDLTAHGFRSTFRDWAAERTNYPREVAEMALAHTIGDRVEAAYRRGDLFEKRRRMMGEWAKFCATAKPAGDVVTLRAAQ